MYFSVDRYLCLFCLVPPYLNSIFHVFFFLMILSNEHFTRLPIYIMTHFSLMFHSIFIYIFKLHATTKYLCCYSYMIKKDGANNFWIFCSAILWLSLHFFHFPFIPFGFCYKWRLFILYRKQIFKPFLLDRLTARKFCIFLSTGTEQAFTQTHIKIIIIRISFATIIKSGSSELISLLTFHRLCCIDQLIPLSCEFHIQCFFW